MINERDVSQSAAYRLRLTQLEEREGVEEGKGKGDNVTRRQSGTQKKMPDALFLAFISLHRFILSLSLSLSLFLSFPPSHSSQRLLTVNHLLAVF